MIYVRCFIDNCLDSGQYLKAEIAARYLVWATYWDKNVIESAKRIRSQMPQTDAQERCAQHTEQDKLWTMDNLHTRFDAIDSDMKKPRDGFFDSDRPLSVN